MSYYPSHSFVLYAAVLMALLGFAAWRDIATRTIPDTVSVALIAVGALVRVSEGWGALGISVLVGMGVFLILLPVCSRGLLGGADLKLLSALAVGLSPQSSLSLLAIVTMAGGGLALTYLTLNKLTSALKTTRTPKNRANSLLTRIATIEFWRIRRGAPLPYGIAIAIGAAVVVFNQPGV